MKLNWEPVIGLSVVAGLVLLHVFVRCDEFPAAFLSTSRLSFVLGATLGLSMLSSGLAGTWAGLRAIFGLFIVGKRGSGNGAVQYSVLARMCRHSYVAGTIGALMIFVTVLATMEVPADLGVAFVQSALSLLYSLLLSECFIRPAMEHIGDDNDK